MGESDQGRKAQGGIGRKQEIYFDKNATGSLYCRKRQIHLLAVRICVDPGSMGKLGQHTGENGRLKTER